MWSIKTFHNLIPIPLLAGWGWQIQALQADVQGLCRPLGGFCNEGGVVKAEVGRKVVMYPNNIPEEPRRRATVECIDALRSLDGVHVISHDDKSIVFDFGNFKYEMGYDWHDGQDCFFVDESGEKFEEEQLIFVFLAGKKTSEAEFSMQRGGERLIFWLPQVRAFFAGQLGEGKSKEAFRKMCEAPGFPNRENQDFRESFNRKLPDD